MYGGWVLILLVCTVQQRSAALPIDSSDGDVCAFLDSAQNATETCCLVPNPDPSSPTQHCYMNGPIALNVGCCDSRSYWLGRGYDPASKVGECYCGFQEDCYLSFKDKRSHNYIPVG